MNDGNNTILTTRKRTAMTRYSIKKLRGIGSRAIAAGLAFALVACGPRIDVAEWGEEVMLNDGRMIVVQRKATAKAGGFPEPRGANLSFELEYEPMGLRWVGPPRYLHSFDVIEGVAWLATSADRESCEKRKPTDFHALFFKWNAGKWEEVDVSRYPIKVARHNLFQSFWGRSKKTDAKGLVTWTKKQTEPSLRTPPESMYQYLVSYHRYCSNYTTGSKQ
jgi:hypothetical protein